MKKNSSTNKCEEKHSLFIEKDEKIMKRFIALLIVIIMISLILPVVGFSEETMDCAESALKGKSDASTLHKAGRWFAGGLVGGTLLFPIGGGLVIAIAAGSAPRPRTIPDEGTINENCYLSGYTKKARSKNVLGAMGGGLLGTAIIVIIGGVYLLSMG